MTAPLGPNARLALSLERLLVDALALEPRPLPPSLASARGVWRGQPVEIETRHFAGERVGLVRVATLAGAHIDIGNVLALPRPDLRAPILGVDVVGLGRDALFAADLSPLDRDGDGAAGDDARLRELAASRAPLPSAGALPAWAGGWFGPAALFARVGDDERAAAAGAVHALARGFVGWIAGARPAGEDFTPRLRAYNEAHRRDDRGLTMLGHMFGAAWSARYLEEALFPAPGAP